MIIPFRRDEEFELRMAVDMIIERGAKPSDIALKYPELYIVNFEGIERLYEIINQTQWRWRK